MHKTRAIKFNNLTIGGGNPITVQSMLSCNTLDKEAVFRQIDALTAENCDIIRLAVESDEAVIACREYLAYCSALMVADIQFDYRLAIKCCEAGFEKIRFNPGNIGGADKVRKIIDACKANGTAVRIGVNSGSLEKEFSDSLSSDITKNDEDIKEKKAEALAKSALKSLENLKIMDFDRIILSVKSSDVKTNVLANRILAKSCDFPLHIGVTESGRAETGELKSAIGIGALLLDGIGDTIRVSLTGNPVSEVRAARKILAALRLTESVEIVSCPTCSRCKYDLESVVKEVEKLCAGIKKRVRIAIMGCAVNGPGEAADADFGVAFGGGKAAVFAKGNIIKTVAEGEALSEIKKFIATI